MAYFDIVVTYINPLDRSLPSDSEDWLRIIQADSVLGDRPKTSGAFTAWLISSGKIDYLANNEINANILYQQYLDEFFGPCGDGSNGTLMFGLKIIKSDPDMQYNLVTSYGSLRSNGEQEHETELHIDVSLESEITITDHKVIKIVRQNTSYLNVIGVWEGYVFDEDGEKVYHPDGGTWDAATQKITFDQKYLGTYRFRFVEEYDSWTLTVPPRTNLPPSLIYDIDIIYDATVRAFYSGDYAEHAIEIPDEAKNCPVYGTDIDGNTYIEAGNYYGYDTDGDGVLDGGSTDVCTCPFCAGTGDLIDCVESATQDCTCPYCSGTGIIPGCREREEGEMDEDDYTFTGQTPSEGICYKLHIRRNRCTGELIDKYLEEVACPEDETTT